MTMFYIRFYLFFFLLLTIEASGQHKSVSFGPSNEWVESTTPNFNAEIPQSEASGFYFLLVDVQEHLETHQYYRRFSYKILSTKGVQDMGDITIDFDPEYQQIILHDISIIRDGKKIKKLQPETLQVVQRESGMEQNLYNGRLTVIANLTDVRVGDIIDYSYTISGSNPVYEGMYQRIFSFQDALPFNQLNFSLIVPYNQDLSYKLLRGAIEPEISKTETGRKYSWKPKKVSALEYEDNTPAWFDAAPAVEITQFQSWQEVVNQFEKHYKLDKSARAELSVKASKHLSGKDDKSEKGDKINQLIKFVQDEVRYLGFENGLNSHIPSNPMEVFNRKYGDCKDKSFLLSQLLQEEGISAYPMLVHSVAGRDLKNSLPSPNVFDHCIVQIRLKNDELVYVDPTISDQGGEIGNIYFPDYHYGLLLKPGTEELTKLPAPQLSKTEITETFELDDIGGGANFTVKTVYSGNHSEVQRQEFAESTINSIQQAYTSFYAELYPGIKVEEEVTFEDDKLLNEFTVFEKYRIDSLWTKEDSEPGMLYAEFNPLSIRTHLFPEKSTKRKMPFYIDPEIDVTHKTIVFVPEAFNIQNENRSYGTKDFAYTFDVKYKNAKLEITHDYKALSDHVAPIDLASYLQEHSAAQEHLAYWLSYNSLYNENGLNSTSWWAVFLTLISMGGTGFVCYRIYKKYDLPSKVSPRNERKIGGWLILVGVGLVLTPLLAIAQLISTNYFSAGIWTGFLDSVENFKLGMVLFFELLYNSAYLIFSLFVILVFFRRRTIAPKIIIFFYAITLIVTALDTFAVFQLNAVELNGPERQEMITDLFKEVIRCLIWIPYFIYSSRVEETFTKTLKKQEEVITPGEQAPLLIP